MYGPYSYVGGILKLIITKTYFILINSIKYYMRCVGKILFQSTAKYEWSKINYNLSLENIETDNKPFPLEILFFVYNVTYHCIKI